MMAMVAGWQKSLGTKTLNKKAMVSGLCKLGRKLRKEVGKGEERKGKKERKRHGRWLGRQAGRKKKERE